MEGIEQIAALLEGADKSATLFINSFYSPCTDAMWDFMSRVKVWFPLYAIVLFFTFRRLGWKKALVGMLAMILTVVACDQFANLFKASVGRMRPCNDGWMIGQGLHFPWHGSLYGFFSGHAANTFGFAAASTTVFRYGKRVAWYEIAIFAWAFLVSLSRIFLGMHFLGDVVVGALVGLAFGYLFACSGKCLIDMLGL